MGIFLRAFVVWCVIWLIPTLTLTVVLYAVATHPFRRRERARLFLDLLQTGLREGDSVEHTIVALSQTRDYEFGARLHLLAAYIEKGLSFQQALRVVPTGLPTALQAMLENAPKALPVADLLPAARRMLDDLSSRAHSSMNYMMMVLMIFTPGFFIVTPFIKVFVWPKLEAVLRDMELGPPGLTRLVFEYSNEILLLYAAALLCFSAITFCYLGSPSIFARGRGALRLLRDELLWKTPWVRRRVVRNFSLMLSTFLDSEVPEERSVILAAECTGNLFFIRRAEKSIDKLKKGASLIEAVEQIDPTGELSWRLDNAAHGRRDFQRSLRGWHEMLESKAFQSEQAAAHLISSSFIVVNGVFVAAFVTAVFALFISIIDEGVLW